MFVSISIFTTLLLCFLYSPSPILLASLCADYFLIFTNHYTPGILFFIFAQCGYRILLGRPLSSMLSWASCSLIGYFLLDMWAFGIADTSVLLAVFYLTSLVINCCTAWKDGRSWIGTVLILLLLCDIHVGIANSPGYLPYLGSQIWFYQTKISPILVWIFYLPAQILMTRYLHSNKPLSKKISGLES